MNSVVRMAVLSDLHARRLPDRTIVTTWVRPDQEPRSDNPLHTLDEYITQRGLTADVLLCPGDLCDQADWSALGYAWKMVKSAARALGASEIIATVGNHDIDSRGTHRPLHLDDGLRSRALATFPMRSPARREAFWRSRVTAVRRDGWQVVVLNSSIMAYLDNTIRDVGTVDDAALGEIRSAIEGETRPVNVLLCHHHPMRWTRLDRTDNSEMHNGPELVQLLEDHPGQWTMIHGHRHQPHLEYLPGGSDATVRLACGSVGAQLSGRLGSHVRNQIHIVEFHVDTAANLSLGIAGQVRSHSWRPVTGWSVASDRDGLPAVSGFGFHGSPAPLARRLVTFARNLQLPALERAQMLSVEPALEYLLPADVVKLRNELANTHGCELDQDMQGVLSRLKLPVVP